MSGEYDHWRWTEPKPASPDDPIANGRRWREERDRYREALSHIVWAAEHPSPTVHTTDYLAQAARAALERGQA